MINNIYLFAKRLWLIARSERPALFLRYKNLFVFVPQSWRMIPLACSSRPCATAASWAGCSWLEVSENYTGRNVTTFVTPCPFCDRPPRPMTGNLKNDWRRCIWHRRRFGGGKPMGCKQSPSLWPLVSLSAAITSLRRERIDG